MIAHLSKRHDRARFDCGVAEMNVYLRQQARQDAEKGLSRTFVSVADATSATVQGFYTLAFALLAFEEVPREKRLSRYPAPVALLAQLAVDSHFQKQGLGERLLFDALARADEASERIGLYALVLDAREEGLFGFYERYGFQRATGERRMYLKMSAIRQLGLRAVPLVGSTTE